MKNFLLVMFVVISIIILVFMSKREGVDDTLVRLDKLETADKKVENRLSLVEKELRTAKEEQSKGEAQVNAGLGSIQAIT